MKLFIKTVAALLCLAVVLTMVLPGIAHAKEKVDFDSVDVLAFDNTHVNTGNQRQDFLAVALTQVGYTEGRENDTKYGTWYGMPFQAWCATFVTWCARQAEISTDILGRSAVASPKWGYFDIPYYDGKTYTPKPGDLFFMKNFAHVGIVYYTDGEYFYCVEGNGNPEYSVDGFWVIINKRKISDYYFGVPAFEGGDKDHSYTRGVENGHPHKIYYKCSDCGATKMGEYAASASHNWRARCDIRHSCSWDTYCTAKGQHVWDGYYHILCTRCHAVDPVSKWCGMHSKVSTVIECPY